MVDEKPHDEGVALPRKRILLVDDDREIVESMRIALDAGGYEVLVARDGNQGLAMAEREDPDLVILDMMMPKRSGFLVLEKLRRSRPAPRLDSSQSARKMSQRGTGFAEPGSASLCRNCLDGQKSILSIDGVRSILG